MKGEKKSIDEIKKILDSSYPNFSFDLSAFKTTMSKISIVCPEHGKFEKYVYNLLRGDADICSECKKHKKRQTKLKEAFIKKARQIHGDKYQYVGEYVERNVNMKMICPIHGEFEQQPANHLRGRGCKQCGLDRTHNSVRKSELLLLEEANLIHNNAYTYNLENYINGEEKMEINCSIHGPFFQQIKAHLRGQKCPKCANKMSKEHLELEQFLRKLNVSFNSNDRTVLDGAELDIVIPDKKIAIEINGLFWHRVGLIPTISRAFVDKNYHLSKTEACEAIGWHLIQIFDYEWNQNKELLQNKIKHILGLSDGKSIYARNCKIQKITGKQATSFLTKNHIQGADSGSQIKMGAFHNNKLVAIMTFIDLKDGSYKLSRFATGENVVGIFSKLLSYFEKSFNPKLIETFADRRFSSSLNNVYLKNNFNFIYNTEPAYFYYNLKTKDIKKRQTMMRHKLYKKYPEYAKLGLTEKQIAIELGYDRVYDCGHIKFEKKY